MVTVVDGYAPVGFLRPIAGSDQPFSDSFDDKDVWWDEWVPVGNFLTIPELILSLENSVFDSPALPGRIMQTGGKLVTEQANGMAIVSLNRFLSLEGLSLRVTIQLALHGDGGFVFGPAIGQNLPGLKIACLELRNETKCDLSRDDPDYLGINLSSAFTYNGRITGTHTDFGVGFRAGHGHGPDSRDRFRPIRPVRHAGVRHRSRHGYN